MNVRYRTVNWEFNVRHWANVISGLIAEHGIGDVAFILEVSESALDNWANGRYTEGFRHPNMTNLLKVCNIADIDPREMFTTSE